jgi:Ca-activated chloride channel family protein
MGSSRVHNLFSICVCFLALGICGLLVQAQEKPAQKKTTPAQGTQDPQEPKPVVTETTNVQLAVAVFDEKTARLVIDLKQTDFEVTEDGAQQKIESFRTEGDLPIDVAVLMDTSNSVKPKLKFEKDAAVAFIYTMLQQRRDRALFATFDSEVELQQDFTNRTDLLSQSIDKVKARGETRMYDAIYKVCEEKMFGSPGRRRAMVIITDGEDTISERNLKEAIDVAQRSETTIYVISTKAGGFFGVDAGMVDRKEDKVLKKLAEETGGRAFFAAKVIELERSFTTIVQELRSQYLIAYSPSNEKFDGKFREIQVRLPGYKNLKIRTKRGYTAVQRSVAASQ